MLEKVCEIAKYLYSSNYFLLFAALLVLYILYWRKFRYYIWIQPSTYQQGNKFTGQQLPSYPNGWFCVARSDELKKGDVKYLDYWGRQLAVFRGMDGEAYCLDAYCAHMGANLAIAGSVKNTRCLQCPFHGWQFDGQTGNCVMTSQFVQREGIQLEYSEDVGGEKNPKETFKSSDKPCKIQIQKYLLREISGFVYVWLHAKETVDHKIPPPYEPFNISDFTKRLDNRGLSVNYINCHTQDITENGGDVLHFPYVHTNIVPYLVDGVWTPKWLKASDPDLKKKLEHPIKYINDYKMDLIDRFITEQNKDYIGIVTLENSAKILGSKPIFQFSLTGFQVGPGIVYLFIKGPLLETILFHFIRTKERLRQEVFTEIFNNKSAPYWFSAMQLRMESFQVQNDGVRWDNKKFGYKLNYDMTSDADKFLKLWREWYAQFYEGCKAFEKERSNKGW